MKHRSYGPPSLSTGWFSYERANRQAFELQPVVPRSCSLRSPAGRAGGRSGHGPANQAGRTPKSSDCSQDLMASVPRPRVSRGTLKTAAHVAASPDGGGIDREQLLSGAAPECSCPSPSPNVRSPQQQASTGPQTTRSLRCPPKPKPPKTPLRPPGESRIRPLRSAARTDVQPPNHTLTANAVHAPNHPRDRVQLQLDPPSRRRRLLDRLSRSGADSHPTTANSFPDASSPTAGPAHPRPCPNQRNVHPTEARCLARHSPPRARGALQLTQNPASRRPAPLPRLLPTSRSENKTPACRGVLFRGNNHHVAARIVPFGDRLHSRRAVYSIMHDLAVRGVHGLQ